MDTTYELTARQQERFWAKVDRSQGLTGCWLWLGYKTAKGYGKFKINYRGIFAHRIAYYLLRGPIPESKLIDHTCHTHPCVNPMHLRPATHQQNMENRAGAHQGTKSGLRGVYPCGGRWTTRFQRHGVLYSAGTFADPQEAAAAIALIRLTVGTHSEKDKEQ